MNFPYSNINSIDSQNKSNLNSNFKLQRKISYIYKSNQILKGNKNLNLVANTLTFKTTKLLNNDINIELVR
jgi:hypothetical protein